MYTYKYITIQSVASGAKGDFMCIAVFIWQSHPVYPFLLLLNRDEYHNRPTKPLAWWEGHEIAGGRDEVAGGTWLACSKDGRMAFLTNVREINSNPKSKSRGHLPVRFLESKKSPMEFAKEMLMEADQYNGFNLVLIDLCSKAMVYVTNRPNQVNISVIEVSSGIHVLSNARLDTPWPKAQRLGNSFRDVLYEHREGEVPIKETVQKLMMDTVKVEDEKLLPHIYPPQWEYQLSSIFIDTDSPLGRYGTRSSSAVSVKTDGEICFYERYLDLDHGSWKEQHLAFHINKEKVEGDTGQDSESLDAGRPIDSQSV